MNTAKHTITCELGCRKVIARGDTWDEAEGIAVEQGAIYCGEPGEWECGPCRMQRFEEGRGIAATHVPIPFALTGDPMTDYLTAKGEL